MSNTSTTNHGGALSVRGLQFGYRRHSQLFEDLTWRVTQGTRVILLGPNGAGKTTLMKILAGLLDPRAGEIQLNDAACDIGTLRENVAMMPQHVTALPRLKVKEQVAYAGWLGGLSLKVAEARADTGLSAVGLQDQAEQGASRLSGGQLRRLGLAEALVRQCPHLLLDEPTAGLDPAQRARFRGVVAALPKHMGIVVSTHETHDIADVFDRVCIVNEGRIAFDGSLTWLLDQTGRSTVDEAYIRILEAS